MMMMMTTVRLWCLLLFLFLALASASVVVVVRDGFDEWHLSDWSFSTSSIRIVDSVLDYRVKSDANPATAVRTIGIRNGAQTVEITMNIRAGSVIAHTGLLPSPPPPLWISFGVCGLEDRHHLHCMQGVDEATATTTRDTLNTTCMLLSSTAGGQYIAPTEASFTVDVAGEAINDNPLCLHLFSVGSSGLSANNNDTLAWFLLDDITFAITYPDDVPAASVVVCANCPADHECIPGGICVACGCTLRSLARLSLPPIH